MVAMRMLLAFVFHAAHLTGRIVGRINRRMDRVLIIRTDGMGDALLFEPALRAIAAAMPSRKIHLWAPQLACDLLEHCPVIHQLMVIPRGFKEGSLAYFASFRLRAKIGFALGRWTFDKAIYPSNSPEPFGNWLLTSARAFERWINVGDTINQFDWQRGRKHELATRVLNKLPGRAHELLQNQHLAEQCNAVDVSISPGLHLTETIRTDARAQADAWRDQSRKIGGREIIGVVPAASMRLNSYPDANWAQAISGLWRSRKAVPILLGGPTDSDSVRQLAGELSRRRVPWFVMDKPIGILEMAAFIAELDGVLSVDTGLAHLAIAQNVPTVVLVGGGNPKRFFPWPNAPHHVALNTPMPCEDCNNRCMFREAACITLIDPDQIIDAFVRLKTVRRVPLPMLPAALRAAG
jgi:ADP-heptose:LPS heptosyltransferase